MFGDRIVTVGLLTERDLQLLGSGLDRQWPADETPCFYQLLQAIDEADRAVWRARDDEARLEPLPTLPT